MKITMRAVSYSSRPFTAWNTVSRFLPCSSPYLKDQAPMLRTRVVCRRDCMIGLRAPSSSRTLGDVGELRSESLANRCGQRPELSPDVDGVSHAAPVMQPSRLASARPWRRWKGGGPCRIRTCGLRIRSPTLYPTELRARRLTVAEREGFEPSIQLWTVYWFSKPAPSASRPPLPASVQPLPRATCPRKRRVLDRALPGVKDGLERTCPTPSAGRSPETATPDAA